MEEGLVRGRGGTRRREGAEAARRGRHRPDPPARGTAAHLDSGRRAPRSGGPRRRPGPRAGASCVPRAPGASVSAPRTSGPRGGDGRVHRHGCTGSNLEGSAVLRRRPGEPRTLTYHGGRARCGPMHRSFHRLRNVGAHSWITRRVDGAAVHRRGRGRRARDVRRRPPDDPQGIPRHRASSGADRRVDHGLGRRGRAGAQLRARPAGPMGGAAADPRRAGGRRDDGADARRDPAAERGAARPARRRGPAGRGLASRRRGAAPPDRADRRGRGAGRSRRARCARPAAPRARRGAASRPASLPAAACCGQARPPARGPAVQATSLWWAGTKVWSSMGVRPESSRSGRGPRSIFLGVRSS